MWRRTAPGAVAAPPRLARLVPSPRTPLNTLRLWGLAIPAGSEVPGVATQLQMWDDFSSGGCPDVDFCLVCPVRVSSEDRRELCAAPVEDRARTLTLCMPSRDLRAAHLPHVTFLVPWVPRAGLVPGAKEDYYPPPPSQSLWPCTHRQMWRSNRSYFSSLTLTTL